MPVSVSRLVLGQKVIPQIFQHFTIGSCVWECWFHEMWRGERPHWRQGTIRLHWLYLNKPTVHKAQRKLSYCEINNPIINVHSLIFKIFWGHFRPLYWQDRWRYGRGERGGMAPGPAASRTNPLYMDARSTNWAIWAPGFLFFKLKCIWSKLNPI